MRNAFIDELVLLAEQNSNIALVVGDLGYSVVEPFAERFPDRFINAGVAEQNMTGLAAGMASEGFHVFTYSIANFPTFRCAEQIRNDVAYHNLPVTIVAVGGGLGYGALGYSHHAVQDYAFFRTLPNMLIAAPGDPMEVRACLRYLAKHPQPSYLRLGKAGEPIFHKEPPVVSPGKWVKVSGDTHVKNSEAAILTTGGTLQIAMENIKSDANLDVFTLPLWGMESKIDQPLQVKNFEKITTMEDHLIDGGFGSWMLESLLDKAELLGRVELKALHPRICGTVGAQKELNRYGGIALKVDDVLSLLD